MKEVRSGLIGTPYIGCDHTTCSYKNAAGAILNINSPEDKTPHTPLIQH